MVWKLCALILVVLLAEAAHADTYLGSYNPSAKSIPYSPPRGPKRGLATPFQFTYIGSPPQAVQDACNEAGNGILASLIDFPTTIKVQVTWTNLGVNKLGSAAGAAWCTSTSTGFAPATVLLAPVMADAFAGFDIGCPASGQTNGGLDIVAQFNSGSLSSTGVTWDFDLDPFTTVPPNQVDFVTVVCHELIHGLGFATAYDQSGTTIQNSLPGPSMYDEYLRVGQTSTELINDNSTQLQTDATGNNLYFQLDDGTFVPIYAPKPWITGTSLAHYVGDEASGNMLMNASMGPGVKYRYPGPWALKILRTMGYNLSANTASPTPGPTTATTTIAGTTSPATTTTVPSATTTKPAGTTTKPATTKATTAAATTAPPAPLTTNPGGTIVTQNPQTTPALPTYPPNGNVSEANRVGGVLMMLVTLMIAMIAFM